VSERERERRRRRRKDLTTYWSGREGKTIDDQHLFCRKKMFLCLFSHGRIVFFFLFLKKFVDD
jgi:hypothetical protein